MQADLVIHGGLVANEWGTLSHSIAIKDGRILAVGEDAAFMA